MGFRIIEIVAPQSERADIAKIVESQDVLDWWRTTASEGERFSTKLAIRPEGQQSVLDALQAILDRSPESRILIHEVVATLPALPEDEKHPEEGPADAGDRSREELYVEVSANAAVSSTYLALCALSAIVAGLGMIEDSVAVVIGAMVIAPLLGPNLALALGTTLGDARLSRRAILTSLVGLGVAILVALIIAQLLEPRANAQLLDRTQVDLAVMVLAMASGAAAVLSLTSGAAAGLVGVMVAVALMPPAVAAGLFLGWGETGRALAAAWLLLVNIAAINLSAKIVFMIKGISPRRWHEKTRARRSAYWALAFWGITSALLALLIFLASA
ncbi:MAG: TIGR00341 family protein [Halothiobacillaceae bacterium]